VSAPKGICASTKAKLKIHEETIVKLICMTVNGSDDKIRGKNGLYIQQLNTVKATKKYLIGEGGGAMM
jgi:MoaA/NifB/PqqE/SkfB family radical SAM enzyme